MCTWLKKNNDVLKFCFFVLNLKIVQPHDPSQLPWVGPVPGDIAEVEAYCRIFRSAEWLHTALMDTLCNPMTGECIVSYDSPSDGKPLSEDKIVSVLGCMVSLLNKGREDVLSGRSSIMNSFSIADVSAMEDELPPLAIFRREMKRCCESLHVALENYLMPGDDRSLDVWRKLQRLKNVCYDSGFPRGEDYPGQILFANWTPVYLSTSKEDIGFNDSEVAFWKGGQVTEEGLTWLMEKGYKTIVDLRAENVKDKFYQAAINDAIASGKIEFVKIPVEVGTAPSMEQVEKFASLVSDCSKRPIYLHSKEGIWRTSAMVSRWKQYMTRSALQSISNQSITPNDVLLQYTNGTEEGQKSSVIENESLLEKEIESFQENSNVINGLNGVNHDNGSLNRDKMNQNTNGVYSDLFSVQSLTSQETDNDGDGSIAHFSREIDPLKSQVPTCNIFSRKEMSRFLMSKKISPPSYFNYQLKMLEIFSRKMQFRTMRRRKALSTDPVPETLEAGSPDRPCNGKNLSLQYSAAGGVKYFSSDNCVSTGPVLNGFGDGNGSIVGTKTSSIGNNKHDEHSVSKSVESQKSSGGVALVSVDDEVCPIEGDMCASTTGVVRVQSRKKAEMFLVRTDGFTCAREKVTESSLAFTHPSTQQQMLMWKSTPKTVLLLKKLGQELMEEAKEVLFDNLENKCLK